MQTYDRSQQRAEIRTNAIKQSQFFDNGAKNEGKRAGGLARKYSSEIEEVGGEGSWSRLVVGRLGVSRNVAWIIAPVDSVNSPRGLKTGRAILPSTPPLSHPLIKVEILRAVLRPVISEIGGSLRSRFYGRPFSEARPRRGNKARTSRDRFTFNRHSAPSRSSVREENIKSWEKRWKETRPWVVDTVSHGWSWRK